jgi:hypothetical protein
MWTHQHAAKFGIYANSALLVRPHRLDGDPFEVAEFIAHDSMIRFRSLNHVGRRAVNALNLIPLSAV